MNTSIYSDSDDQKENPLGDVIFSWRAYDYDPHERGLVWIIIFCVIVFGSAIAFLFTGESNPNSSLLTDMQTGNIFMAITIFLAAAVYFYTHKDGEAEHDIIVYEKAVQVDMKIIPKKNLKGFWFIYEDGVSIINLELQDKKYQKDQRIKLQMGNNDPEFFKENFAKIEFPELFDKQESLLDKWIRILKL